MSVNGEIKTIEKEFIKNYFKDFNIEEDLSIIVTTENGIVLKPIPISCEWTTERKGSAGVLSFEVLKEQVEFTEGNRVSVSYKNIPFFVGYVFKKSRNKNGKIKVTAYDQLRYLKNNDTYVFKNVTATEIIQMLAKDFNLKVGNLDDSKYKIVKRREDNKSLFDMILYALQETLYYTKKEYIFYDDCGKLTLTNDEKLRLLDVNLDDNSALDYSYESTIDSNTYNQIKLARVNKEKGTREIFMVKDPYNIKSWGILQYFESIDEKVTDAKAKEKVENLIKLYNHKRRLFSMSGIFGDIRVRGGSSMLINLDVGDITVNNFMIVNKVIHKFEYQKYTMNIDFIGQMGIKEKTSGKTSQVTKTIVK